MQILSFHLKFTFIDIFVWKTNNNLCVRTKIIILSLNWLSFKKIRSLPVDRKI